MITDCKDFKEIGKPEHPARTNAFLGPLAGWKRWKGRDQQLTRDVVTTNPAMLPVGYKLVTVVSFSANVKSKDCKRNKKWLFLISGAFTDILEF